MNEGKSTLNKPDTTEGTDDLPFSAILAEYLFVILPLIVIFIVRLYQGCGKSCFYCPEFSFAAAVLFGQSIIKMVSGVSAQHHPANWQNFAALISALIVLGLVPSLVILCLVLLSNTPSFLLGVVQLILFILSSLSLFVFGTVGHSILIDQSK